jgi:asparagine synthase (glutamine-hydrolysing)
MQVLDLDSWLPNNLLHRGDYTTMQASIEQRVPFLDRAFTPWAVALPDKAKVSQWRGKQALRQAFIDKLPTSVTARQKSGFRLPLGAWLSQPGKLQQLANDMLAAPDTRLGTWMSKPELQAMLSPARLATTKGAKLAWTALSIELWLRARDSGAAA